MHAARISAQHKQLLRHHSLTSTARASSVGGTSSASAFAVDKLMTNSNLVGCSIGILAGCVPRSTLSTISAARRHRSAKSGPYDISAPASTYSRALKLVGRREARANVIRSEER